MKGRTSNFAQVTGFSHPADFEAFLDFLCNGDRSVLTDLERFQSQFHSVAGVEAAADEGYRKRKFGKRRFDYRTESTCTARCHGRN